MVRNKFLIAPFLGFTPYNELLGYVSYEPTPELDSNISIKILISKSLSFMKIPFVIDSHIRVNKKYFDPSFIEDLKEEMFFELSLYGNDRKEIFFYKEEDGQIILPRGFVSNFESGLKRSGFDPSPEYRTVDSKFSKRLTKIKLRPHQEPAVRAILSANQGIYQAPPGSGKTVTILEAVRRSKQKTLILVDKVTIAEQWRERAAQFLGVDIGFIGDGAWDEQDITVALRQSIYARRDEASNDGFFKRFGFVVFDECHHSSSDSYQFIIQKFSPTYLIGVSATPHKNEGMDKVIKLMLGKVIHRTTDSELQGLNILMKPRVEVKETKFYAEYKSWVFNGREMNNYQSLIKKLVNCNERNRQIASDISNLNKRKILVVTKRLSHIESLSQEVLRLQPKARVLQLTGREKDTERKLILEELKTLPAYVLFSTIADEALDIPSLDALLLVFPTKNVGLIEQQIGRIERFSENKETPLVIDYNDKSVSILNNQFYKRLSVYRSKDMNISI